MYQNKEQNVLYQFSKIKEQNTLYQNKEQNVLYQFSKIKSKILFIRIKSKMLFIRIKSNCSLSRIKSKTRIKRSHLESICSLNGAGLYNCNCNCNGFREHALGGYGQPPDQLFLKYLVHRAVSFVCKNLCSRVVSIHCYGHQIKSTSKFLFTVLKKIYDRYHI